MATVYRTPGVYVEELDAFPPSIVSVQTAIPAFIGYTEFASVNGKPVYNKAIKLESLVDYQEIFGVGFKQIFTIVGPLTGSPEGSDDYDFQVHNPETDSFEYYKLEPATDPTTKFNLYESMRLFFANGGGTCYVVSVGSYEDAEEVGGVQGSDLEDGLAVIAEQVGPTMLVVPDAVLLTSDGDEVWESSEFAAVATTMLEQCEALQDRVAILDVYGSQAADKNNLDDIVEQFWTDVGSVENPSYGMAYFPFLNTTVVSRSEIDYTNVDISDSNSSPGPYGQLQKVLQMENDDLNPVTASPSASLTRHEEIESYIEQISPDNKPELIRTINQNLENSLPVLANIERVISEKINHLPASGAMAGVFTKIDNSRGVWNAPANISLASVDSPTFKLNDAQQGDLNMPVNGIAIDAIREFPGRGSVVWGARTLDGNSNDYRYIQVRRTLIYIEQSIKNALDPFVFAANDGNTWSTVVSMVSGFLQGLWSQGGLMGATANEAFSVECGLGSTMTAQDILDGYMYVQVTLQMVRPAEFIVLTFTQKMEG